MEYHSNTDNLDEEGYTRLDFHSRGISQKPIISEKGKCASSSRWCFIAVTLGILFLITLGIAVVLGILGVTSSSCPPRWILYEKSCYLFRLSLDSWDMSKEKCSLEHSSLLKIDDLRELDFITSQTSLQPYHSFWIGLSRPQAERGWLWEDGSAFSNVFQVPNTVTNKNVFPICAWVHQALIYDQLCNVSSYSICEKELEN
ncbi:C-type lectin domain family 7 member A isoform X1 [Echinops telfairi]|uniref:C-type lectin domain family 7 member A isoform X1 n=1 Tax=Echinops telfairi TaxID=9371 RepID=A0AC55DBT0_ECHTE|nr:C-type lectin domain family 7 member A isoform X1 [Echinops telfairi]